MEANETEDETLEILYQVVEHSEAFWIPERQGKNKHVIMKEQIHPATKYDHFRSILIFSLHNSRFHIGSCNII